MTMYLAALLDVYYFIYYIGKCDVVVLFDQHAAHERVRLEERLNGEWTLYQLRPFIYSEDM